MNSGSVFLSKTKSFGDMLLGLTISYELTSMLKYDWSDCTTSGKVSWWRDR